MSLMRIIDTTDGQFIGATFNASDNPIALRGKVFISVERIEEHETHHRFINSNYIIDAEVDDGQDHK